MIILDNEKKPSSSTFKDFKITDVAASVSNRQPPNPDWLSAKQNFVKSIKVEDGMEVINLD